MPFMGTSFCLELGEGIRGVLQSLFNDSSVEAKLLANQLELLGKIKIRYAMLELPDIL